MSKDGLKTARKKQPKPANPVVKRNAKGHILKGSKAVNPHGRPKGGFNSRTWAESRLRDELPELLKQALIQVQQGNDKVLNFLLGRILPVKPILERENCTELTDNAQQNLLTILQDHNDDKLSTDEANNKLALVQKQIEIQQSDFVKLQNLVTEQNKRMDRMMTKISGEK